MKKILFSIVGILILHSGYAQQYQCLLKNTRQYFTNKNGYLRGMRIDSVKIAGADTVYYPFHSLRGTCYSGGLQTLDSNGGSWLGKRVIQKADGSFLFDTYLADTVLIKTQANAGDTWVFYNDTSAKYYKATVTVVDTMTVSGSLDSVKKILITAYNAAGADPTNPVNNFKLILSKNHGFVTVFDLYTFPYTGAGGNYAYYNDYYFYMAAEPGLSNAPAPTVKPDDNQVFNQVTFHNPTHNEVYDFQAGDIISGSITNQTLSGNYINEVYIDSISGKSIVGGNYIYAHNFRDVALIGTPTGTYSYTNSHVIPDGDTSLLLNDSKMPEEWNVHYIYHYWPADTNYCYTSKLFEIDDDFISVTSGHIGISNFENCGAYSTYKLGIGKVQTIQCEYGGPMTFEDNIGAVKKNGISCGPLPSLSIPATTNVLNAVEVYPNPANEQVSVKLPANNEAYTLSIHNMLGQVIYTATTTNEKMVIDIHMLPAGLYNLKITNEHAGQLDKKLVIMH